MRNLDEWLEALVDFSSPDVFNPWNDHDPLDIGNLGPIDRTQRLRSHLNFAPSLILIGEAPGYQGCRFSGVPFTNEKLLMSGAIPRMPHTGRITKRVLPFCEPSATIMWGALHSAGLAERVVMWNAFAWHPHKPGVPLSNRAPTKTELGAGLYVLRGLLALFSGVAVVPVGRVAERTLAALGVATMPALRHPAMGGASQFRAGAALLAESFREFGKFL